jgi:hemerythrin-like domain-containing protein
MNPLSSMIEEHGIILRVILVLNGLVRRVQSGEDMLREPFDKVLEIIRDFVDECHHGKEEIVLFPLVKILGDVEARDVSMFLEDHEKGRNFIKALRESVSGGNSQGVIMNAKGYSGVLLTHIKKENMTFPAWIEKLSNAQKEEISEKFEEIEEKTIGLGMHQAYVQKLNEIQSHD